MHNYSNFDKIDMHEVLRVILTVKQVEGQFLQVILIIAHQYSLPFNTGIGTLYGRLILHMLPASAQRRLSMHLRVL
jgi:hypothetical protein